MFSKKSYPAFDFQFEAKTVQLVCPKSNIICVYGGSNSLELVGYNRLIILDALQGKTLKILGETSFGESNVDDICVRPTDNSVSNILLLKNRSAYEYSITKLKEGAEIKIVNHLPLYENLRPQYLRSSADQLCVAFDNGSIYVWKSTSFGSLVTNGKMKDPDHKINAHKGLFSDFDLSQNGGLAVSVSNTVDEASLWSCISGKLLMEISSRICYKSCHTTPITSQLQTRVCRFGRNESQPDAQLLYSIHSPSEESEMSKTASFLIRWDCKAYKETRIADIGVQISSALAVTPEGRYVGVGNRQGSVDVYISFSLMRLYHVKGEIPIFDITFLSTGVAERRGNDMEMFSLGEDKSIRYHNISSRQTISVIWPIVFAVLLVALVFKIISELGL